MGGMGNDAGAANPAVVNTFHADLARQAIGVLVVVLAVGFAWRLLRLAQLRAAGGPGGALEGGPRHDEVPARRLLRVGFGLLWVLDGVLQAQPAIPLGLVPDVVRPAAASSPPWVRSIVAWPSHLWLLHPVLAAAATVWLQLGLGALLLSASSGKLSRAGGLATACWALLVWVFGEAFGGIFAPGASWLFGAPGPALFYVAAGALVALPERSWNGTRVGKAQLRWLGAFLLGMALLQAWPGRGFWHGRGPNGLPGALSSMVRRMTRTPQPRLLSDWLSVFATFATAHGFAVNLFVVVALTVIGTGLFTARPRLVPWATAGTAIICLAAWALVQDLGVLGGVGTDPNSMLPMVLFTLAGCVALVRPAMVQADRVPGLHDTRAPWRETLASDPTYALRSIAAVGSVVIVLIGAAPLAIALATAHAGT